MDDDMIKNWLKQTDTIDNSIEYIEILKARVKNLEKEVEKIKKILEENNIKIN